MAVNYGQIMAHAWETAFNAHRSDSNVWVIPSASTGDYTTTWIGWDPSNPVPSCYVKPPQQFEEWERVSEGL